MFGSFGSLRLVIIAALVFVTPLLGCSRTGTLPGTPPGGTPVRSPEPPPWVAPGALDKSAFAWSVQVGDVTDSAALLHVHTTLAEVELRWVEQEERAWQDPQSMTGLSAVEGLVRIELDGLQPDTAYNYAFFSNDGNIRSRIGRFRTALPNDGFRIIDFGASSCYGGANQDLASLSRASEAQLDVFLHLGDTVYADGSNQIDDYRQEWRDALSRQGLKDVHASTSVVSTWDDHEVNNDWNFEDDGHLVEAALQAYREGLPQREGPDGQIWHSLLWGEVMELFVLDSRGEREGDHYLSVEQMDWLKQGLLLSRARFKLILNSVPITDENALFGPLNSSDRWDGYPEQRRELIDHIVDNEIEGILFLSGDHHMGMLSHVEPVNTPGHDLWEVLVGPSGSTVNPIVLFRDPDDQYEIFIETWNYTRFTANPETGNMRIQWIDDKGEVLDERDLSL